MNKIIEYYPEIAGDLEKVASEARADLGEDLTGAPGENRREPGIFLQTGGQ